MYVNITLDDIIYISKLTLSIHRHVVLSLAPIYDTTFLFDSFPPLRGKLPPKKNLLSLFSRKRLYFFWTFFLHRIIWLGQGRPVNVKHDARCVVGKVGGKTKNQTEGGILIYYFVLVSFQRNNIWYPNETAAQACSEKFFHGSVKHASNAPKDGA